MLDIMIQTSLFLKFNITTKRLVLSSPAGPNRHKSGVNRLFKTAISSRFSKRLSYVQSFHWCSHIGIALKILVSPKMRSFLTTVVKLYSYIDSDVGNLRKSNIFAVILDL